MEPDEDEAADSLTCACCLIHSPEIKSMQDLQRTHSFLKQNENKPDVKTISKPSGSEEINLT